MNRIALAAILLMAAQVRAQDMPLSMFVQEGETWTPAVGEPPETQLLVVDPPDYKVSATVVSPDGETLYVGYKDRTAVWRNRPCSKDRSADRGSSFTTRRTARCD